MEKWVINVARGGNVVNVAKIHVLWSPVYTLSMLYLLDT